MNPSLRIVSGDRTATVTCLPGETLLESLQRTEWHVPAPCGGEGRCGKCLVTVEPASAAGERDAAEERFTGPDAGRRLACRAVPCADLTVTLPHDVRAPDREDSFAKGGAIQVPATGRPVVALERLQLAAGTLEDQRSVLQRLRDATGVPALRVPLDLLRYLAPQAAQDQEVEIVFDTGECSAIDLARAPDRMGTQVLVGVAVDIGTTTVAAYLIDLSTHTVLASRSSPNAQERYGADVISRMTAYENGSPLSRVIREQIASLANQLAADVGIDTSRIVAGAIVGNTTMIHLLLDLDPAAMSRTPFTPVVTEALRVQPREIGLPVHPRAVVRIPPGVSAYVGTDIVADLLSSRMHRSAGVSLLVDIGTNGEIVCGGRDGLLACSTAAGPAFEGATIRHGSGGVRGAINHVRRDGDRIVTETIGGAPPLSICGTGLMDAVAMLIDDGIVDETGRMDLSQADDQTQARYARHATEVDGEPAIVLAREIGAIVLTQSDIRQVQLAKGAIAAGVRVLLQESGVEPHELAAVYLAGGFGTYVRPAAAIRVGLLPGIGSELVTPLGNAAGAGAARLLVDDGCESEAREIESQCRYVELSGSAAFQNYYMEEMLFPPPHLQTGQE